MRIPQARVLDNDVSGYWEVWVDPMGNGEAVNVSMFRGAATSVDSISTTDPFGPATATVTFPAITVLDRPGVSDLWWLQPEANVDIVWVTPPDENGDQEVQYTWQGYFVSFEYGEEDAGGKLTITCQGALKQLDNYLAKPEYLFRPLAYEYAIYRQFNGRPDLRLSPMAHPTTAFPDWWSTYFQTSQYTSTQKYLVPQGPGNGDLWSGMVTRETGKFDPVLSSYIQGLLSNMYTDRGQFTLMLGEKRRPVLYHRDVKTTPDASTLVVHVLWPGVQLSVTRDFSQRLNVVYGQGKGLSGNTFSNMNVTADGSRTFYTPFAYRRDAYPADYNANPWYNASLMRKEVSLNFYQGIEAGEANEIARKHLERFSDPGYTASLTLKIDPLLNDAPYARQRVVAGQTIQVKGLFGDPEGILFHITEANLSADNSLSLTLDSKYRDQLTVQEVRKRGRDSLVPVRMLSVGQYQPLIPDILHPWTYEEGAGFLPMTSSELFLRANQGTTDSAAFVTNSDLYMTGYDFPWEGMTSQYPPSQYPEYYVKLSPADVNPDNNWTQVAPQVRLASKGDIRLFQIAAFDAAGNPKKVPFHVSVYYERDVLVSNMPLMQPSETVGTPYEASNWTATWSATGAWITFTTPTAHGFDNGDRVFITGMPAPYTSLNGAFTTISNVTSTTFRITIAGSAASGSAKVYSGVSRHYPFFFNAWEQFKEDGTRNTSVQAQTAAATLLIGYGNYWEKAGYWPSSSTVQGAAPTGYLVDETGFSWDFTTAATRVTDQPAEGSTDNINPQNVMCSVMIYCDQEWNETTQSLQSLSSDVYFLGRFFRKEPGQE